jgi:hypothetical protein
MMAGSKQDMENLRDSETSVQAEKNGGAGCLPVKSMSFSQQFPHPPRIMITCRPSAEKRFTAIF